jgi:hypothetical protein
VVTNCGFQSGAFQSDAFQVCTPIPPTPIIVGGARGYGRMRIAQYPVPRPEDDEVIVAMLLELLDD